MKRTLLLLMYAALAACTKKEDAPPKPVVEVKTATAEEEEIRMYVRAPANIFPREQANIASRITASIRELLAHKGDSVKAGQTLAVLESPDVSAMREEAIASVADARATLQKAESGTMPSDVERARGQLETAEAAYNQAREIYNKRQELFKLGAIPQRDLLLSQTNMATTKTSYDVAKRALDLLKNQSRGDLEIAQSRLGQAQARLKGSDAQIGYTKLVSPFAGTITEQFVYPGDMANPATPIFTVMDLSRPVARAQVPEAEARGLRRGQPCQFQSADNSTVEYQGRISLINKAVDPARRTIESWCEIPNPSPPLRAGVFGEVRVLTTTTRGIVVPQPAVQLNEGSHTGWVMSVDEKNIAHKREVETGGVFEGKVQVLKGIHSWRKKRLRS